MSPSSSDPEDHPLVRSTSSCVTRVIAGETLIVPIAGGVADLEAIYTLNDVASRMWALLESPITPRQLAARIAAEFEVEAGVVAGDVAEFLDTLRSAGLVRAAEGSHGNA